MKATRMWLAAGLITVSAMGAAPAVSQAQGVDKGLEVLAKRGFGTSANSYAWGLAWFKGKLYVGTGRQVACFESWTRSFFLPILYPYINNPSPNTRCPNNPFDQRLRAEIWQYTPKGGTWRRVYKAPAIRNPASKSKMIGRDIAYRGMKVRTDDRGKQTLFVSGVTANEVLPSLKNRTPPRMLRSTNGRDFKPITLDKDFTVTTASGPDQKPIGFRGVQFVGDRMYAMASTSLTGDGAAIEIINPDGKRPRFRQVSPPDVAVFEMQTYRQRLWLGTGNSRFGYGVYRSRFTRPRPDAWTAKVANGAGRGLLLTSVVSMHVFKGDLYVGSAGWTSEKRSLPATEVIKILPSGGWEVAVGNPRTYNGDMKFPVSGLGDGWNNGWTGHPWRMVDRDGVLFAGTNDYSSTLISQGYPLLQQFLAPNYGFDIWASCDGTYWQPITRNAYNGTPFDFGARTMVSTPRGVVTGSADHANGTTIFMDRRNPCGAGIKTASSKKLVAHGLDADRQKDGNVVTWGGDRPAGARYRVLRAELPVVNVSVAGPLPVKGGFTLEDDLPRVVPPDTPGSDPVNITSLGAFSEVANVGANHYVDDGAKPGKPYAYQIQAVDAQGRVIGSSGVQTTTSAPLTPARVAQRISEARGASAPHSLGGANKSPSVADLRLAAANSGDPELVDLVARLERRERFEDAAGGR